MTSMKHWRGTRVYVYFFFLNELMTNIAGICDFGGVFHCILIFFDKNLVCECREMRTMLR